jgi:exopolysaccharide biosynthesis polyprenyl glycosylphosphotransferase
MIMLAVLGLLQTAGLIMSPVPGLLPQLAALLSVVLAVALVMGLYRRNAAEEPRFLPRCVVAILGCALLVGAVGHVLAMRQAPPMLLVGIATLSLAGMMLLRVFLLRVSRRLAVSRRILTVMPEAKLAALSPLIRSGQMHLIPTVQTSDRSDWLDPEARQTLMTLLREDKPTDVILCDSLKMDPELAMALSAPRQSMLRVSTVNRFMAECAGSLPHDDPETLNQLVHRRRARSRVALLPKRVMDLVLSLVLLVILSPVMLVTALMIRLTDGGPALYRQTRVGLNQKCFTLLKFRSMRVDAEANGRAQWAAARDSRITPIGSFLRRTRLDELPQLINVVLGDMSLVGPRPERPEMIPALQKHIPAYDFRHLVPPGLTGWAQINYPYGASVEDAIQKTNYDLYYVTRRSCVGDLLILMETIRVVLLAEGSR